MMFFFISLFLIGGACHADTPQPVKANGRAWLLPSTIQTDVGPGTVFNMSPLAVSNIEFKDGVFTVIHSNTYTINVTARVCATAANKNSSITVGIFVNNTAVKKIILHPQFPPSERGLKVIKLVGSDYCDTPLKTGDRVFIRIMKINLPRSAKAYFAAKGQEGSRSPFAHINIFSIRKTFVPTW